MNGGHGASGAIRMSASITPDVVREAACVDCGASFCQDCLVYLQAKPLCGQCKNQRLRALHRELPTSQLALLSLLLALFTGPLAFILYAMGVMGRGDTSKFPLLGLVPQLIALALESGPCSVSKRTVPWAARRSRCPPFSPRAWPCSGRCL